jgi:hypothetical protein
MTASRSGAATACCSARVGFVHCGPTRTEAAARTPARSCRQTSRPDLFIARSHRSVHRTVVPLVTDIASSHGNKRSGTSPTKRLVGEAGSLTPAAAHRSSGTFQSGVRCYQLRPVFLNSLRVLSERGMATIRDMARKRKRQSRTGQTPSRRNLPQSVLDPTVKLTS